MKFVLKNDCNLTATDNDIYTIYLKKIKLR